MCACRHACLFSGCVALGWAVTPVRSTPIVNDWSADQVPPNTKQTALSDGRYLTGKVRQTGQSFYSAKKALLIMFYNQWLRYTDY